MMNVIVMIFAMMMYLTVTVIVIKIARKITKSTDTVHAIIMSMSTDTLKSITSTITNAVIVMNITDIIMNTVVHAAMILQ